MIERNGNMICKMCMTKIKYIDCTACTKCGNPICNICIRDICNKTTIKKIHTCPVCNTDGLLFDTITK